MESFFFIGLTDVKPNFDLDQVSTKLDNIELRDYEEYFNFFLKNAYTPYLYYQCQRNNLLKYFPQKFSNLLRNEFTKNSFRNLKIRSVFIEITNKLQSEQIDFVLLKGIELQYRLYREPFLRPMIDIDILVKPEDVNKVTEIILQLGAKQVLVSETPFIDSLKHHASPLIYKDVAIEVHRELLDDYDLANIKNEDVWAETEIFQIEGIEAKVMKPELLLVYLCHHIYNTISGGKIKLIAYLDIYKLLDIYNTRINNEKLQNLIQFTNTETSVIQTVVQTNKLFPMVNIPKCLIRGVSNTDVSDRLLFGALNQDNRFFNNSHYITKFSRIEGTYKKILYLSGKLFPSKQFIAYKYKVTNRCVIFFLIMYNPIHFLMQALLSFFYYLSKILTFR